MHLLRVHYVEHQERSDIACSIYKALDQILVLVKESLLVAGINTRLSYTNTSTVWLWTS